jgi:hypothetical protein
MYFKKLVVICFLLQKKRIEMTWKHSLLILMSAVPFEKSRRRESGELIAEINSHNKKKHLGFRQLQKTREVSKVEGVGG